MLSLLPRGRILVAVESVDGRKGIDALASVVRSVLRGERVEGPTLFDGTAVPEVEAPTSVEPPTPELPPVTKRKGHGRRCKPKDLPRRREEIDLSEPEKVCACCGTLKIRIGQTTSERLDYQPMAIFVRELVRPTYTIRTQSPNSGRPS